MPVGTFHPHRSQDFEARTKHIETFLSRMGAVPVDAAVLAKAAKNGGSARASLGGGEGGGGGGTGGVANLFGDVTGPATNTVAAQATGAFSVLGGDLTVAAGKATVTFTDAGGGSDSPTLRPTFLNVVHHTAATTVPGVGAAFDYTVADDAAADQVIASLIAEITTPTAGSLEATLGIVVKHQNQDCEVVRFRGQNGMAATNVGVTGALKGFTGGQMWVRGNVLMEGLDGNTASITDAGTTNTVIPLVVKHLTTGAAAAGLGVEVDFVNQNSAGVDTVTGFLQSLYTGGTTGAENGSMIFGAIYGGARVEVARFRATGMAVVGGVGGQFFCRGDFLHAGTNLAYFNGTPVTQRAGASAAGIAAIADANVKAALTAIQAALGAAGYNIITSPA